MPVTTTYQVSGMTCGHCADAVTEELNRLPGVREVTVDVASGGVTVTSHDPLAVDAVRVAVDEAGYTLAGAPEESGAPEGPGAPDG